jgi:hypothetical protein
MTALRLLLTRIQNWWRYDIWTTCPHSWVLHEMKTIDGIVTTAHYYWDCPDCGASAPFFRETGQ